MAQGSVTIRIRSEYRDILRELAKDMGTSMQVALEEAIDQYQRIDILPHQTTRVAMEGDSLEWRSMP